MRNCGLFLDVGANHGLFSFGPAGRHGASVDFHLFEPNPTSPTAIRRRTLALYSQKKRTLNAEVLRNRAAVL
jgi:hypothetical protein